MQEQQPVKENLSSSKTHARNDPKKVLHSGVPRKNAKHLGSQKIQYQNVAQWLGSMISDLSRERLRIWNRENQDVHPLIFWIAQSVLIPLWASIQMGKPTTSSTIPNPPPPIRPRHPAIHAKGLRIGINTPWNRLYPRTTETVLIRLPNSHLGRIPSSSKNHPS